MSYSRSLVHRDVWGDWDFPSNRLVDQNFGVGVSDLDFMPTSTYYSGRYPLVRRSLASTPRPVFRQLSSGGLSEIRTDTDKFQVLLDVSHFAPEEITVKTVDDQVVVVGNHEEKVDEHGFVSRQFTRRYMLPHGVEPETVKSTLSADGVLTVEAPRKKPQQAISLNERPVPISVQGGVAEPTAIAKEIPVHREQAKQN